MEFGSFVRCLVVFSSILLMAVGGEHVQDTPKEPCPHGCRCVGAFNMHQGRHRWHHLLAAYRMRRLVYGQSGAGSKMQIQRTPNEGREMTCLGLKDLPEYVPSDISKVTLYGQSRGNSFQKDDTVGDATSGSTSAESKRKRLEDDNKTYNQLTSIDKYSFHRTPALKDLFIEGNRIKALHPYDFQELTHLRRLRMRNNRLQLIWGHALSGLVKLEEIDLAKNHLKRLPKTIFNDVPSLKRLLLNDNRIRSLNEKIFANLKHLVKLDLSHNYLRDLSKGQFFTTSNLRELSLEGNHLSVLRPEWFTNLGQLTKLSLKGNRIVDIVTVSWSPLISLKHLDLAQNQISHISYGSFRGLDSLETLSLKTNNVTTIDDRAFDNLLLLEELHLDQNKVSDLTNETFLGLESLLDLSLSGNQLLEVPHEAVEGLTKMQSLNLAHNEIKIIREHNFFGLGELRELRLEHNEIKVVEKEGFAIGLVNNFSKLTWLYLNHNRIGTVTSDMLYGLSYLKFLNVGQNSIEVMEEGCMAMLARLHTLILSQNRLKSVGVATFKHLKNLRHLNLAYNVLERLEANAFLGLDIVEDINLQANDIEEVTKKAFLKTPGLISVNLKKNKLSHVDLSVMEVLDKLKYLDLSRNSISTISLPDYFLRDLFFLSLADNDLQRLPADLPKVISVGGALHLYGNPLSCDCELRWLNLLPGQRRVTLADSEDIVCKTPKSLTGEKVMSLQASDFQCTIGSAPSLAADQSADRPSRSCDFMEHASDETSREHINAQKEDVFDWYTSLFDAEGKPFCRGIRMDRDWILTPSHCWKERSEGSTAHVQFGPSDVDPGSSVSEVEIRTIKHYTGPLDLALVKTSRVREDDQARFFPCFLSKDGAREAIRTRLHGVLLGRASYTKSESKVKVRGFPFRLRRVENCPANSLCLQDDHDTIPDSRYDLLNSAFFVKVGRSKWALAGFTGDTDVNDSKHYNVALLHPAIRWLDGALH